MDEIKGEDWFGFEYNNENLNEKININDEIKKILLSFKNKKTSKMIQIIEKVKEIIANNRNIVIWSVFNSPLEKLKVYLEEDGITCEIVNGKVSVSERERIVDEFKKNRFSVLLTNPQTFAESVSLHDICHDAIYIDYSYNLVHFLQSRDRIHRLGIPLGTETNYYLSRLFFGNESLDKEIIERLKQKEKIMYEIIDNDKLIFSDYDISFSDEDILSIYNKLKLI